MLDAFPQEIYEEIVRHLWDDPIALSATALTCSTLLRAAQKHLFSRVVLYPSFPKKGASASQLQRLLSRAPHLGPYVLHLELRMCAGRCQWVGWIASLECCLRHLSQLKALVIRVDQGQPYSRGFTVGAPPVDPDGVDRMMRALVRTVQLPSLVVLDTYRFDVSPLLRHCWHIRELVLSQAILPAGLNIPIGEHMHGQLQDCRKFMYLESLRLELSSFESRARDTALWRTLYSQGISLRKLRRLSIAACEVVHDLLMKELLGILEECADTVEELEIDTHFTARDLDSLGWTMSRLPSLRALHLHLYSLDALPAQDLHLFIASLTGLLRSLPCSPLRFPDAYVSCSHTKREGHRTSDPHSIPPSSRLEHLRFTDHILGRAHVQLGDWRPFMALLCDRVQFPAFKQLSWYACAFVREYLRDHIFAGVDSDSDDGLSYMVEVRRLGWDIA